MSSFFKTFAETLSLEYIKEVIEKKKNNILGENCNFFYDLEHIDLHLKVEALQDNIFTGQAKIKIGETFRIIAFGIDRTTFPYSTDFSNEKLELLAKFDNDKINIIYAKD